MAALELSGKVAIVTGSGRGLGRAYAEALALAGAAVVINDVDSAAAGEVVRSIESKDGRAAAEVVPVGSTEAAERLVARAVNEYGRLDILCTNAGILRDRVLWNMTDDDFDKVIETHLRGTFTTVRAAVRQMRAQGSPGRIVLVGSPAGQRGNFGQTAYAGAKAGIAAFARTWALECARSSITVNAIVPVALTRMMSGVPGMSEHLAALERGDELPDSLRSGEGIGTPEDVAPLVVFLASDRASGITGQCIGIGGDKLSLWSHPQEVRAAYRQGGWTVDAIDSAWGTSVGQELQTYGIQVTQAKPV